MLEFSDPGPRLSLSDIEGQEGRFGEAFPAPYREFLLTCNGGIPSLDGVEIDGLVESPTDVQVFLGINREEETETLDWNLDVVRESCKGAQVLPVACDSFGTCFACARSTGNGVSSIWITAAAEAGSMTWRRISRLFSAS